MNDFSDFQLSRRFRRLRRSHAVRQMVKETTLTLDHFVQPLFIHNESDEMLPVASLPGQSRIPLSLIVQECEQLMRVGIRAVALFPQVPSSRKTEEGEEALNEQTLILKAVRLIKSHIPELLLITDIALDPYTTHGHDGVLDEEGDVDNDATVRILGEMACLHAANGVDWVAPSDMMDGRVKYIRQRLDASGYTSTSILAYSAKFASAFYGPFREAVGSVQGAGAYLDKSTYQLDPANPRQAIEDALLDEAEGADFLMVKPAGPYLDILSQLRAKSRMPLAAYQVSGEYAQIHAAARLGWLDYKQTRDESLLAIRRAGADIIFTYFAREIAEEAM